MPVFLTNHELYTNTEDVKQMTISHNVTYKSI